MRPRLILRRILPRNSQNLPFFRSFAHNTPFRSRPAARPQLPFLSIPKATGQQRVRYLTTEKKAWIKHEVKQGLAYGILFTAAGACFIATSWAIKQEALEREYPTPHEWGYLTRIYFRNARQRRDKTQGLPNWVEIMELAESVVKRLEDPNIEGKGVHDASHECPPGTKDVSAMPESWRRGYFESLMLYAATAQMLNGWMRDKTRDIMFPPEVIIGPSNPRPKPIRPGQASAPREEDCEAVYPSADDIYVRIVSTPGFTTRQRMEAALAHASWLEYNNLHGPASIMYERAVELSLENTPPPPPIDTTSHILKENSPPPSENLLTSLTALATFQARSGNVSSALPILVSILKARKSLPAPDTSLLPFSSPSKPSVTRSFLNLIQPPAYPLPPPDGTSPPVRDSREICLEAALHLHIGEILYTSRQEGREEGLAWTRDAVDLAEEQLRRLGSDADDSLKEAKTVCRDCLSTGMENWGRMVARLAREERAKQGRIPEASGGGGGGWFGLWGQGEVKAEDVDRWAAEEKVIEERQRRAAELLEDLEPPRKLFDFGSIFKA
ncbi:hypothetical protein BR93DRAFT_927034 [Coniochaeta sp. PMI_546]|nr:hypothetical protein BR93DRAFT_927034 [Coniochaeta sp. PMI_546]